MLLNICKKKPLRERKFLFFHEAVTGSNGECVFNFWRNCKLFTNVTVQFTFPPAIYEGSSFSMSSSTLGSVDLFHYSHSTRQVVVFHCGIICTFVMTLNSFPCVFICPPCIYFVEVPIQKLCSFFSFGCLLSYWVGKVLL